MKIINKIIIGLLSLLFLGSCSIDTEPRNQTPVRPIVRIEDGDRLFTGVMAIYRVAFDPGRVFATEVQSDMLNATADFGNRNGPSHQMGVTFSSADTDISYIWSNYYSMIYNANSALASMIAYVPKNANEKILLDYYVGAIHYLRASGFHNLIRLYATAYNPSTASTELGVPLELSANPKSKSPRSTIAEVYTQIGIDIAIAEELLAGNTKGAPKVNATIPTIDAVKALNARVKLDTHQFTEAATIAQELIASSSYSLNRSEVDMQNEWFILNGARESIFNMFTDKAESAGSISSLITYMSGSTVYFKPDFVPTQRMLDMYSSSDIRGKVWLRSLPVQFSTYKGNLVLLWKFRGIASLDASPTDWSYKFVPKVYRISEMYLIAAEALMMAGQTGQATTLLNEFQASRSAVLTSANMSTIQAEWKKEFVGEGLILPSMKRWNSGFTNRPPQVLEAIAENTATSENGFHLINAEPNSPRYFKFTWAIPANDIQTNESLIGQQNPGW